jgi:hypothetical protein
MTDLVKRVIFPIYVGMLLPSLEAKEWYAQLYHSSRADQADNGEAKVTQ